MKPRKLRIEGLNSFVAEQEIDFTELTGKGFFGIFGPTGSGKSTILDAMTIALYGEISRGKKNEFINSFKKDMNVVYEFEIGGALDRRTYSVERHYKRKKDGGILCDRAVLVELTGELQMIIAEGSALVQEEIVSIIGLKCDDFTRSVVLPQGRFSEFLKLTKGDRGKMLERILSLEEFGSKMVTRLKNETQQYSAELERLNGALGGFRETSDEALDQGKQQLKVLSKLDKTMKEQRAVLEAEYRKFSEVWELQKELQLFEDRRVQLNTLSMEIQEKTKQLELGKRALAVKPMLVSVKDNENRITVTMATLEQLLQKHLEAEQVLSVILQKHELAVTQRDSRMQPLIQKEVELTEALKLQQELVLLDKELLGLREAYETWNKNKQNLEKLLGQNLIEKENCQKSIDSNELKLQQLRVTPEHREKIASALLLEKEFQDKAAKLKKANIQLNELGAHLVRQSTELISIGNKKQNNEKALFDAGEQKKELERINPEKPEQLVTMQLRLQQLTAGLEELSRNNASSTKLSNELSQLVEQSKQASDRLEVQLSQNALTAAAIEQVKHELEMIKTADQAAILSQKLDEGAPCPVCGSTHHPEPARKSAHGAEQLQFKEQALSQLSLELVQGQRLEHEARLALSGFETSQKIKEQLQKELRLELDGLELSAYQAEKDKLEAECTLLKRKQEKYVKEATLLEEQQQMLQGEVHQTIVQYERAHAEYENNLKQKESLRQEQEQDLKQYEATEKEFLHLCSELGIQKISEENTRILNNAAAEEQLRVQQEQLRSRLAKLEEDRSKLEGERADAAAKLEAVSTSGKERRKVKDDAQNKMNSHTEGREPKAYYEQVLQEKNALIETEAKLRQELETQKALALETAQQKQKAESNLLTLRGILAEDRLKLAQALREHGFVQEQDALEAEQSAQRLEQLEQEVKQYHDELKSAMDNIGRIKSKLAGHSIDKDAWEKLLENRQVNEKQLEENTGAMAACRQAIERMESDLLQMRQLIDKRGQVAHQLEMLEDITKLVAGNKFVEYAATNQLRHIAMEASRRLGDITRGRYALELDSSNEFVMRDDYSGGVRRSADTLSGGETFLTSLCLALALSSNIQLKGRAPLEFFFLDEGFGTLDPELLEVVMSSLERLRSDRLCVGIISHVEELKSRVPIKLLVTPATMDGEGTKVKLEYS